jgi:hypothetical protein
MGKTTPPPVIVAFTAAMYAGFVHNPLQIFAIVGQVTDNELVFSGDEPT